MERAFIIRPFGIKKDSAGKELDFERVHKDLIAAALDACELGGGTTGEIVDAGNIREDMFSLILEADIVICDVTTHNANVFYELGIRHALRKRRTILIKGDPTADIIPFDLLTDRYLAYAIDNPGSAKEKLEEMITATLNSDRETDSPIFKMLPALAEAKPSSIQVVPIDFREDVERARASGSKGLLRLLAQDVRGMRFQWIGLELIAYTQWEINDYEGAKNSLEAIRETQKDNTRANLALANIYERLYRKTKKPEMLVNSEQAIERVLASKGTTLKDRVEALTLKGRNIKTGWRLELGGIDSIDERRQAAMNSALRRSYEAYREGFFCNLNHFYSGLAALQMGTIFLSLSEDDTTFWKDTFDDEEQADLYRRKLVKDVETLFKLIPASIEANMLQMSGTDPERAWAEVSKADVLFLTEKSEQRVIKKYKDVVPKNNPFVWDSVKGQLQLFADLNVKAELANNVIAAIDDQYKAEASRSDKPTQVVIFSGHSLDEKGRAEPRFPADRAERAKELIREALNELGHDYTLQGLASAAPGADIIFHEVCDELNISSLICLPIRSVDYARSAFDDLDDWRARFLNLQRGNRKTLELNQQDSLPKWLGADTNSLERGNRWLMQMALTWGAEKVTLVVLWDEKDEDDARTGTGHMVRLAREAGEIYINIIKTEKLLA